MSEPLFVIERIRKQFGPRTVLDVGGLALQTGQSYALTGDNGAGKSTLLRVMAGLEPAQIARALYRGQPVDLHAYPEWLRRDVIYVHQHPYLFRTSVRDNIGYGLKARGTQGTMLDHDAVAFKAADLSPDGPIDPDKKFGTVGAVALDAHGHVAAATSTGGMTNKHLGRVGDAPLIGAGCYANDATCAVSTTGTGEMFMRLLAAYDVSARMEYRGATLEQAAADVIMERLPRIKGRGGLIAIDAKGNVALPFNTEGMYRGFARVGETPVTAIYR